MGAYVARRVAVAVCLLFALSVITFLIESRIPANPAGFVVDLEHASPEQIAKAEHDLGVDRPIWVQYGKYLVRVVHGDFGLSWSGIRFDYVGDANGIAVAPLVRDATWVTASVVGGGFALLLLIAVPLGAFLALRPRSLVDRMALALSLAAVSTHPLVVGLLLQLFVGNRWHLAPPSGYCPLLGADPDTGCGGPLDWASHLALPWLTFALFFVALYLRMARARMLEVLEEPYVRTARAKGASELRVVGGHALRNAISPIVTMAGMDLGMAIGIALYVETVFGLPGLGRLTLAALRGTAGYDLPVIVAVVLVSAVAIIGLNLLVDLTLYALDPRIARGGGARASGSRT
jgi:peptide/nickel transport system permease protein